VNYHEEVMMTEESNFIFPNLSSWRKTHGIALLSFSIFLLN